MTTISPPNAALTILQQTTSGTFTDKSAADVILDIAAGRTEAGKKTEAVSNTPPKPATSADTKGPRAVGGTVSSEISPAHMSAMAAAADIEFRPIAPKVEHAELFVGGLARDIDDYNGKFEAKQVRSREEYETWVRSGEADRISKGQDADAAREHTEFLLSDKLYNNYVKQTEVENYWLNRTSNDAAYRFVHGAAERLSQVFGVEIPISYDETGRASLGAFNIQYASGAKMLGYNEDGSMTSYNENGTVRLSLGRAQEMAEYIKA